MYPTSPGKFSIFIILRGQIFGSIHIRISPFRQMLPELILSLDLWRSFNSFNYSTSNSFFWEYTLTNKTSPLSIQVSVLFMWIETKNESENYRTVWLGIKFDLNKSCKIIESCYSH